MSIFVTIPLPTIFLWSVYFTLTYYLTQWYKEFRPKREAVARTLAILGILYTVNMYVFLLYSLIFIKWWVPLILFGSGYVFFLIVSFFEKKYSWFETASFQENAGWNLGIFGLVVLPALGTFLWLAVQGH